MRPLHVLSHLVSDATGAPGQPSGGAWVTGLGGAGSMAAVSPTLPLDHLIQGGPRVPCRWTVPGGVERTLFRRRWTGWYRVDMAVLLHHSLGPADQVRLRLLNGDTVQLDTGPRPAWPVSLPWPPKGPFGAWPLDGRDPRAYVEPPVWLWCPAEGQPGGPGAPVEADGLELSVLLAGGAGRTLDAARFVAGPADRWWVDYSPETAMVDPTDQAYTAGGLMEAPPALPARRTLSVSLSDLEAVEAEALRQLVYRSQKKGEVVACLDPDALGPERHRHTVWGRLSSWTLPKITPANDWTAALTITEVT